MIPETIDPDADTAAVCQLATRWGIDPMLAFKLQNAARALPFDIWIFSGSRTPSEQARVSETSFDLSTHADRVVLEGGVRCDRWATGADVQPVLGGIRQIPAAAAQMGAAFVHQGLRWGGGAPVGADGIPIGNERWHVDLGPRSETG